MLAVVAAILFAVGFICVAFVHGAPAAVVPGFLYLGLFCLAVHGLGLWPWPRRPVP